LRRIARYFGAAGEVFSSVSASLVHRVELRLPHRASGDAVEAWPEVSM
jgi:hypothetical protein